MQKIIITPASLQHIYALQLIGRQTFYETFAAVNTEADMAKYLDETFNTEKIKSELTNPFSLFYLASNNEEAIGYLKLNFGPAQSDLQDDTSLEIERIYVKAAYHGKQVAQQLFATAMEVALAHNKSYIWLGVWEKNPRAIAFYKKNGFTEFGTHIFMLGNDPQTDILMKRALI